MKYNDVKGRANQSQQVKFTIQIIRSGYPHWKKQKKLNL